MDRQPPTESIRLAAGREPALAWLRQTAAIAAGVPSFYVGPQAAWALETWMLGGEALAALEERSSNGESIAARALAAVHDLVVGLAGAASVETKTAPRPDLRARLLASASASLAPPRSDPRTVAPDAPEPKSIFVPAVVAVGQKHAKRADDVVRAATVERLGADRRDGDADLEKLLARVEEWLDFPLLVVSVVHGGETVHRAYRTKLSDPPRVVPREASYCTHCVAGDGPLVVEDARADAFFSRHPAVGAFGLVAYCGVPLRVGIGTADEAVVGTLCGYDVRARPVLVEDAAALEIFARRVSAIVEGRLDDPAWADAGSRGEEREVSAPGPFLDLALVALRRASRSRSPSRPEGGVAGGGAAGGGAALLIGPSVSSIPHGGWLVEAGFALAAGRLPDGRSAWLLHQQAPAPDSSKLDEAAARLVAKLSAQLGAPIASAVIEGGAAGAVDDVDAWVARASGQPG